MAPELRILAEVNVLCTSEHSVEWVPLINHLIPITLTHKQDLTSGATVIHLGADSDDHDVTLDLHISLSESKLKKASECFVRWKDLQSGKIWGLNFLSEEEAFEFMAFCEGLSPSASSSASSNQSLTRRSTSSSQNSSQSRESSSKNSARDDASQACPLTTILTEDNNNGINGGKNVALDNGFGSTCEQFNGNVDRTDNQEDHELSVTEISYFKEMEIFHTTRNPNDVKNVDHFDGDGHVMSHVDHENGDISDSAGLRRTGWLSMKQVLACGRGGRLEQLSHKKWKNFWVVLKGYQLNLYQCDDKDVGAIDLYQTDTTVELERCLAQAVPEHAKLENVFGISTQNGEAYYFQGSCQSEIEGWIVSIHCAAAVQFAGGRGKEQTKWLLNKELEKVRENVDSDGKLKKMAELQLTVVTEPKNKQVITDQIAKWDQTVEKWSLDAYKFQCYLAAVAGVRTPPNPQHVLACASKPTRHVMSRFGAFSVVTFHSIVYSRARRSSKGDAGGTLKLGAGKTVKRSKSSVGYSRLKSALMSSLKISDSATAAEIRDHHSPKGCRRVLSVDGGQPTVEDAAKYSGGTSTTDWSRLGGFVRVELPDSAGSTVVVAKNDMTFVDVVNGVTKKRQLDPDTYFIMFGVKNGSQIEYYTPQEEAFIDDQNFNVLKLCKKSEYNIEMSRSIGDTDASYGLSFKIDNCRVIVSHVEEGSKSHLSGFYEGDEILAVNNNDIFDPENGLGQVLCAIAEPFVSLRIRSLREEVPEQIRKATESIISTLVCPPPPKTSSSDVLDVTELIVPPPQLGDFINDGQESPRLFGAGTTNEDGASVNVLLQSAEEVTSFCRQRDSFREVENQTELSDAEKLRKIILELIDTEKNYLKDVQTLMKRYLEPLKHETFLPTEEVNSLAETVSQILQFQSDFCNEIQQLIDCENNFKNIKEIGLFQNLIYGIGEAFLQYADKFKLYSSFCATHSRIIHMIHPGEK